MSRLDSSAPSLAERLRSSDEQLQRAASVAAAAWAVTAVELNQTSVAAALDLLERGEYLQVQRNELVALVDELDEAAWSLQESEGGGGSSYEASVVADDSSTLVAHVQAALDVV